jgi:ABC-type Co2+ transport system permease subunit
MHIEPGFIAQAKIVMANVAATGLLATYASNLIKRPADIIRTVMAALFFTLFMQSFHTNVGPSELHFVGAMAMYLTLGFIPTLFGFAIGLLFQGLLFTPTDLVHLAVNSLSLILPLIAVHYTLGRKLAAKENLSWAQIVKLDAAYYTGVVTMVGFWLSIGEIATPLAAWLAFASSYLVIVAIEPLVTMGAIKLLGKHSDNRLVQLCFAVESFKAAK